MLGILKQVAFILAFNPNTEHLYGTL